MTIRHATPYLFLGGRTKEAIALYEAALGAEVRELKHLGDLDGSCPEGARDTVMHAELLIGEALVMASDCAGENAPPEPGRVGVALQLGDAAEARRAIEALAEGGEVVEPLGESPWGTLFGSVRDRFGVSWMLDCVAPPTK